MDSTHDCSPSPRQPDPRTYSRTAEAPQPTIERQASSDPQATTADLGAPPAPDGFPARAGRCLIEGEIARGGMGVILRALDPFFGRPLAVKVLLARADERPDMARRFLDEARLTGRLQHPGIPPVHEQGTLDDGRPYFTMKLIQGRTLHALLKERKSPLDDLSKFVTIFGQVCQTVAYAHSEGVIHRDLKPQNIMVGAFGEVQVMDWGLARASGAALHDAEATAVGGDGDAERTLAGQALGTPAYMAPEQARGEQDGIDERADVFGLGAILCTVLTGKPPFQGGSQIAVLSHAQQGDLGDAWKRLDACGADAELVALARACLTADAARRPRHAGEVATATACYLEGVQERLRRAEQEQAAAQVKAVEGRKRQRVWLTLAAVIVAALTTGVGAWLWLNEQRATARAELTSTLEQSRQLMAGGNIAEAMAAVQKAKGLLAAAGNDAELQQAVTERDGEIEFVGTLEKIRTPENTAQERLASRARADGRYAEAFRKLGIDVDALSAGEAARHIEARPALKPYLVAALDDWVGPRRQAQADPAAIQRLLDVARLVDPDEWRNQTREAAGRDDLDKLLEQAGDVDFRRQTTSAIVALAAQLMYRGKRQAAVDMLRKAQWEHPEDFWLAFYHGLWQGQDSDPAEIEEGTRCFAVAISLRPKNVEAWSGYCVLLEKQGRVDEALTAARRAVELQEDSCSAQMALDSALTIKGDREGASRARERAVELLRRQVQKDPGDDEAWVCLGINIERIHRPGEPLAAHRQEAIEANRQAANAAPRNAWAKHNIGALLRKAGQSKEALPWLEEASDLAPDSAYILGTLGLALADAGNDEAAEKALRKAVELQPYYLPPYGTLADVLQRRKDPEGSQAALRQGLRACTDVLDKYPTCFRAQFLSGYYLWKTGDLAGSARHSRKAIEIYPSDADAYANLTVAYHDLGLLDLALETSREGARRAEPSTLVFNDLAFDIVEKGESLDEAAAAVQKALTLDPESDVATLTQAEVFRAQGKFAESLESYRRGDALHRQKAVKKWPTVDWVRDAERLRQLDDELPAVQSGEWKLTTAKENLEYGRLCYYKHQFATAARFYETAFVLEPHVADNPGAERRWLAARAAVLAGLGGSADAPADEAERTHWRRQALDWLRADLALWQKRVDSSYLGQRAAARQALNEWRTHDNLIGVRDPAALDKLPEAERAEWRQFWSDVADMLGKFEQTKSEP
jgi:serine/threonine-protein kinase